MSRSRYDPEAPTRPVPGPLFGAVYPTGAGAQRSSDTSREAASAVTATLRDRQKAVLAALRARGDAGATADDLCVDLALTRNSVAPRLTELQRLGHVRDTGRRRRTPTGAQAAVFVCAT